MRDKIDYDLLLLAKLTPLKASLPVLSNEVQSFTRVLIKRIEDHLSGVKRIPPPSDDEVRRSVSWLAEMFDDERQRHCEKTAGDSGLDQPQAVSFEKASSSFNVFSAGGDAS